jgi:hypothetical protein
MSTLRLARFALGQDDRKQSVYRPAARALP